MTSDWTAAVQAWTAVVALIVAMGSFIWQAYTHYQQKKTDLFRERFEVYSAVITFISAALSPYPVGPDIYKSAVYPSFEALSAAIEKSRFLFGDQVVTLLTDIRGHALAIREQDHPEYVKNLSDAADRLNALEAAYEQCHEVLSLTFNFIASRFMNVSPHGLTRNKTRWAGKTKPRPSD